MFINQLTLNPSLNYQQISQQLNQLHNLLHPISSTTLVEQLQDNEHQKLAADAQPEQLLYLSSIIDYQPWLQHLAHQWQQHLINQLPTAKAMGNLSDPAHWNPITTARLMMDIALHFTAHCLFIIKDDPAMAAERISKHWFAYWQQAQTDLITHHIKPACMEVVIHTARFFQQHWMEYWLNFSELLHALPTNPTKTS